MVLSTYHFNLARGGQQLSSWLTNQQTLVLSSLAMKSVTARSSKVPPKFARRAAISPRKGEILDFTATQQVAMLMSTVILGKNCLASQFTSVQLTKYQVLCNLWITLVPGWLDCYKLTKVIDLLAIKEIIWLVCTSTLQGRRLVLMHLLGNYQQLLLDFYVYTWINKYHYVLFQSDLQ